MGVYGCAVEDMRYYTFNDNGFLEVWLVDNAGRTTRLDFHIHPVHIRGFAYGAEPPYWLCTNCDEHFTAWEEAAGHFDTAERAIGLESVAVMESISKHFALEQVLNFRRSQCFPARQWLGGPSH